MLEECDHLREAAHQAWFKRAFTADSDVRIPDVIDDSTYGLGVVNADPHPGNYVFGPGDSDPVVFLDPTARSATCCGPRSTPHGRRRAARVTGLTRRGIGGGGGERGPRIRRACQAIAARKVGSMPP